MSVYKNFTDLSHPLLIKLRSEAQGTYFHSLAVANISFSIVEALGGADPYRAFAGGVFHDVGKLKNPKLYIENGFNISHEEFEKAKSVMVNHTNDGAIIAREYGLPEDIIAFIFSHHGTSKAFSYCKAHSENEYFYNGNLPASLEEVVVMIIDGLDANVRSRRELSEIDFVQIFDQILANKLDQIEHLKLSDDFFVKLKAEVCRIAKNFYHTRI